MLAKVLSFISQNNLFQPKEPVLLAISGGVDSTVLAHLLKAARCSFALAHINFRLRGSDSDADAGFVQKLAAGLDVPFFLTSFDTQKIAADNKVSIQMAARDLRYEWLEQTRKLQGYHWIVTAHHRDDQIETVLLNMFRGTGIHGLHGIRPKQGKVVRPMLTCSKMEILSFASSESIAFREDVVFRDHALPEGRVFQVSELFCPWLVVDFEPRRAEAERMHGALPGHDNAISTQCDLGDDVGALGVLRAHFADLLRQRQFFGDRLQRRESHRQASFAREFAHPFELIPFALQVRRHFENAVTDTAHGAADAEKLFFRGGGARHQLAINGAV